MTHTWAVKVQTLNWDFYRVANPRARRVADKVTGLGADLITEYTIETEGGSTIAALNADARQWCHTEVVKEESKRHKGLSYVGMGYDLSGQDMVFVTYTLAK